MKRILTAFLSIWFLSLVTPLSANTWTPSTSEENGENSPAVCGEGLATGLKCQGRYCDNVSLQCDNSTPSQGGQWSPYFSEENSALTCPDGQYVKGLRCTGRYCDGVSVQCANADVRETSCQWRPSLSEENGGAYDFGKGTYIKGLKCEGRYCDNISAYVCRTEAKVCDTQECKVAQAKKFAPILKFDQKQAEPQKCFPSDPGQYWDARKNGDKGIICNESVDSLTNGEIPIYYEYQDCSGDSTVIMYWFFYGFQDTCSPGLGSHPADWERVAVKIKNGKLERVMFYQHGGFYTKNLGNFELVDGTHPVAFVGKNSHGSYHDRGGSGSCLYFEDYRNPGGNNYSLHTEQNLVALHRGPDAPEWMTSGDSSNFDGIPSPLARNTNLCALEGCRGEDFQIGSALCFGQCGCSKSDIGKSPF